MARTPDVTATPRSDPELAAPRFAVGWAALVYAVCTMLLAYPALAGKFLINPRSDQFIAGYAFRDFAAQSLKSGHGFPLWNPFIEGGLPYVAAMHGDIFYPTFLLRMALPTDAAMTWEFVIHLFLCGLFTFLFLRAWRFGFYASLIGGIAYMLGGSIAGYASPGHDGKLFVSTMLPAALLLLTRGVRDGRAWAWGGLTVVVGLAVLSPHPQLLQYMLLTSGAFALYIAFAEHPGIGRLPRGVAVRRLGFAAGAVVLGGLIGAIQYLPVIEYTPWSPRAGGHDYATATSYSFPIEETLNMYWPQFSGILSSYWGRNSIHLHSDYFGVVVLMLFGAAFGQLARSTQRSFRTFWIVTGAIALLWAYGGFTPFFHIILAIVPGTKYFRAPSTIIYVAAFSMAVLASIGTERLLARRVTTRYAIGWVIGAAVFGLLMSVGGYTALVNAVANSLAGNFPPEAHAQVTDFVTSRAQPNTSSAIAGVWRSFLFVGVAAALMWAYLGDRIKARPAVIALAAVLAIDLWTIERLYWIFSEPAAKLFATDPAIEAIKSDIAKTGEPGRVIAESGSSAVVPTDPAFIGDGLMTHGLRINGGYHGNELGIYKQLLELDSGRVELSPSFWRHENIQYMYTGADEAFAAQASAQLKLPTFTKLAGPVRNAAGSMVYAYKLPVLSPFSWVASAIVKAPQDQALATVLDARFEPTRVAIADTSARDIHDVQLQTLPPPAASRPRVISYAPGAIDFSLDQPAGPGQALVVSENYFPGWSATVDGKSAPVGRMNYNLIGVALPAGARAIQLRFDDAAYEKGKRVTIVALVLTFLVWIGGAFVERRRRDSVPVAA
ncbi:MAG TPA: hypothetical protein VF785_12400 [Gemmatimonadaceae bacterium]